MLLSLVMLILVHAISLISSQKFEDKWVSIQKVCLMQEIW